VVNLSARLAESIDRLPLVDHHVHGAFAASGSRERFENSLNEGSTDPLPAFVSGFDSQLGFAIRRWCSPVLDLPRHASADEYWARREELGEEVIAKRFLTAAGVSDWVIDTGFATTDLLDPSGMSAISGGIAHEIVRLEAIAAELMSAGAENYAQRFRAALEDVKRAGAVGTKSVIAYRTGFDVDYARASDSSIQAAADRWEKTLREGVTPRLEDATLLVFGLHAAADAGLPIQLHVGFGDRDLDLHRVNPLLLLPLLRQPRVMAVPVLLLHCYPFEREAGYLSQSFDNVYLDVGLAVNYVGARSVELVARSYETAPFAKVLYSSDAFGPAELHFLGARLWRTAITRVFGRWVENDDWSFSDAVRVAELTAGSNARRVYGI
jgi:predicted TIM-barrel fold metal-dependent hydrolase